MANGTGSDSLLALLPDTGEWVTLRVPYPLGFYTKGFEGRIDDPDAGWKGRGIWVPEGGRTPWPILGLGRPLARAGRVAELDRRVAVFPSGILEPCPGIVRETAAHVDLEAWRAVELQQDHAGARQNRLGALPGSESARMQIERATLGEDTPGVGPCDTKRDPSVRDVRDRHMCGADFVQVCTATMLKGFGILPKMVRKLKEFMDRQGYNSYRDFRGIVAPHITPATDLSLYEGYSEIDPEICNGCAL